jgi:hypothetical protein
MHEFEPKKRRTRGVLLSIAVTLWLALPECRAETKWRNTNELKRYLTSQVSNTWSGKPLRETLLGFSKQYKVATLLDRRADPNSTVELSVQNVALNSMLQRLASDHELSVSWLGPVGYFGPKPAAARLRTLAFLRQQEIRKLPSARRIALQRSHATHWDELATPREVIGSVARQYGVIIVNLDNLPHDLWPAGELPPMAMAEQLTVLCAGFDMTFRIDATGTKAQLQPIPARVYIDRFYSVGRQSPDVLVDEWQKAVPEAMIKLSNGRIGVRGTLEEHERIAAFRGGDKVAVNDPNPPTPPKNDKPKKYDLRTEAPLDRLLASLAAAESFEIRLDETAIADARIDMNQVISLQAKDLTLEQMIAKVLDQAALAYKREGNVIHVFPK